MAESVSKCFFFFVLFLCSSALSFVEGLQEMKKKDQSLPSSRRELSHGFNAVAHDTLPTTPDNPSKTIITVPATIPANPVTVTPANPAATPLPIPATTPVTVPSTNPNNPTVPITNPVTTPPAPITAPATQPLTNPVTTYPPPAAGGVPVTTPVTNPNPPSAATNAPATPGQSWCVAKTGAAQTSLQAALDYACGMGGADCSQIQQGGSCYNPNNLQNHAAYAFNSYYQKHPAPTSCDFGGTAILVSSNPSSGSCIYPSSAAASTSTSTPTTTTPPPSTATPPPSTATPTPTTTPPTATPPPSTATPTPITTPSSTATATPTPSTATPTPTSTSGGVPGSGTPPSVLNSSTPGSPPTTFPGFDTPPSFNSTSMSSRLRPFIGCVILLTSFITGAIVLDA